MADTARSWPSFRPVPSESLPRVRSSPALRVQHGGFGLFLRSMTGLNYEAAAVAVDQFRSGRTLTPQQHGYLELLIEVFSKNGFVIIDELYEPPFIFRAPQGPEQLFTEVEIDAIDAVLESVRVKAQRVGSPEG
jgi:type I restriction enzyme R subunit